MTSRAEVPGWIRSWTRCLKSSLMPRSPAVPRAAPMIPPATPVSGASGNRNSSPITVPQNRPLRPPQAAWVVDGGRDVQLSLLVAADDGRVLQIDQVVMLQLDELGPYVLGGGLVRVTNDDQVTHRGCLLTRHQGVTTRWFSTLATPGAAAAAALAALASLIERTCP